MVVKSYLINHCKKSVRKNLVRKGEKRDALGTVGQIFLE